MAGITLHEAAYRTNKYQYEGENPMDRWRIGFQAALRDYGDYEIVEGILVATEYKERSRRGTRERAVSVVTVERSAFLGYNGDHIKILVPPKAVAERDQPSSKREAQLEAGLQIIRDLIAEVGVRTTVSTIDDIARRALEEREDS